MCSRETLINVAEQRLAARENIGQAIAELKTKPEILSSQLKELDGVLETLNKLLGDEQLDPKLKNIASVRDKVAGLTFPTVRFLEGLRFHPFSHKERFRMTFAAHHAASDMNNLMEAGEEGKAYYGEAMSFHREILNTEVLTACCLIEGYGQFIQNLTRFKTKGVRRGEVVLAVEEALGFAHRDSGLFRHIKQWYTVEEGFSEEFVRFIQAGIEDQ